MKIPTHKDLAEHLLPAVIEAALLQLRYFRSNVAVERKADDSPVTVADKRSEEIILEALGRAAPDVPVIAEEQFSEGITPEITDTFFLVDALDGTKSFVKGDPEFTINIALIAGGAPSFGLILLPATGDLYCTLDPDRAAQTRLNLEAEPPSFSALIWTPVRTRVPDHAALTVAISNAHPSPRLEARLATLPIHHRVEASSSLKFCRVAEGRADFYPRWGSISEWDIAAGHAILAAAGGNVTRHDGSPMPYGNRDDAFRTPAFVAWGREVLKDFVPMN